MGIRQDLFTSSPVRYRLYHGFAFTRDCKKYLLRMSLTDCLMFPKLFSFLSLFTIKARMYKYNNKHIIVVFLRIKNVDINVNIRNLEKIKQSKNQGKSESHRRSIFCCNPLVYVESTKKALSTLSIENLKFCFRPHPFRRTFLSGEVFFIMTMTNSSSAECWCGLLAKYYAIRPTLWTEKKE